MTSPDLPNGTARVYEAYRELGSDANIVLNIQGDEPFVDPSQIKTLINLFSESEVCVATLARRFDHAEGWDALFNPNSPKVVIDAAGYAMYFSRSIVPYVRGHQWQEWIHSSQFFMHVGMYGYRADALARVAALPVSLQAAAESLEQLSWLYARVPIRVGLTDVKTIGVDTPDDLQRAIEYCKTND
jgi:3-deoxy-manno-octulosonate cytidylyltransferase (CMP-KDO synthetase)